MAALRRALFLDRDGVINVDIGYLHRAEDCVFVPGIFELVREARKAGYDVFVVTNQAGIARGYYSEETFAAFTKWMLEQFAAQGAPITQVYYCPHHPSAGIGEYGVVCECRKPAPGMLLRAATEHHIDLGRSVMVGDSLTDMQAAKAAKVGEYYLFGDVVVKDLDTEFVRVHDLLDVAVRIHDFAA
ncbi:MAG: D-glycero-beta-D-manno-heptose 1,7-bisphosphate 7-phosphatase [Paraburkholderia sp.]|uniref:D-glycero-beta-D-manno-heptose 1,7-bisphosphate 7-phosphatase n=1 Tax=Paraburkholderia sp. TaxID=1926495 RepID=UPI001207458E|nr:D-glycero-beta-D-manno-heptose 1,7-bisphosphate 7-phosphatase [Paraburkholderia sp.]TAM01267.1 MAG: D-glycero-beta-D-manno-heptose 1,7-bisphosphate 7-phosphatase [Paraburkholderia sp.]TAM31920.1 MAG: D-glycero-beta-D-manno-heptose 1,7-bisphosphate 7-phosphatase [Paraburkholderia sp.]